MAELPLNEAIPRFKSNEDRMDRFTNGDDAATLLTSGGVSVPSLRKFLKDKNDEIDGATLTIYQARTDTLEAKNDVIAEIAGFAQKYLGEWDHLPEEVDTGFPISNGALVSLNNPSAPEADGLYFRQAGQWIPTSIIHGRYSAFATEGQTVITVPGGYDVKTVQVWRNGRIQKIGPSPAANDTTANDCTASNGTTIVFPAADLKLNDWIFVTWGRSFNVANITALIVTATPPASFVGDTIQAIIDAIAARVVAAESAIGTKAPIDSPTFTGTPTAPTPATSDNSQKLATTAYVTAKISGLGATPAYALVAQGVTTSQATLDLALSADYKFYELWLDEFVPVTAGQNLLMRVATDGVPNFSTATSYVGTGRRTQNAPADADWSNGGANAFFLSQSQYSGQPASFRLSIFNPGPGHFGVMHCKSAYRRSDTGNYFEQIDMSGSFYATNDRWTHVRLIFNSGNIATGANYRLIGLA